MTAPGLTGRAGRSGAPQPGLPAQLHTLRASLAAFALLTVALALGACTRDKLPSTLEALVPEGVTMAGSVHVDRLLNDTDIAALYEAAPKDEGDLLTWQELIAKAKAETGIDLESITQAVFFGDTSDDGGADEDRDRFALVARGRFEGAALVSALAKELGATPAKEQYKGYDLVRSGAPEDDMRFVVLSPSTLAWGSAEQVRQVIDVAKGDRKALSGALLDEYRRLGDPLVKMAMAAPPDLPQAFAEGMMEGGGVPEGLPVDVEALSGLTMIAFAFDKRGQDLALDATLVMKTESAATALSDTLGGMAQLFRGLLDDERLRDELRRVTVTATGPAVTIAYKTTVPAWRSLMEDPPQGFGE